MNEIQQQRKDQQILIVNELSRISNIPVAGNEKFFFGMAGKLMKRYEYDFIMKCLVSVSGRPLNSGNRVYGFVNGILKSEYRKTYDPIWEGLDEIGIDK